MYQFGRLYFVGTICDTHETFSSSESVVGAPQKTDNFARNKAWINGPVNDLLYKNEYELSEVSM